MQFNSLGGTGNYAQAGKAAGREGAKMLAAARDNSPDFGKLAEGAMRRKSEEKISAMAAESKVAQAAIKTTGKTHKNRIDIDAYETKQKSRRFAGAIGAAGKLVSGSMLQLAPSTSKRRDVGENDSYFDGRIEKLRGKAEQLRGEAASLPDSSSSTSGGAGGDTIGGTTGKKASTPSTTVGGSDGWNRWSRVIRSGEGTLGDKGYTTQFTGTQFSDTSVHPRQIKSSGRHSSDAAGAYQFLSTTWDGAKNALGLKDFSPASQEKAGRYLAEKRGLNPDNVITDYNTFVKELDKLSPEWASLPTAKTGTSYYGQGGISAQQAWKIYNGG